MLSAKSMVASFLFPLLLPRLPQKKPRSKRTGANLTALGRPAENHRFSWGLLGRSSPFRLTHLLLSRRYRFAFHQTE